MPTGPWLVYDWFDGELLRKHARVAALAVPAIERCIATIFDLHVALADAGWIAGDFYDAALMYDFATSELRVIDLDSYHRGPYRNAMGRMYGSSRFMAPEEFELGALIDERTTVFTLGRAAFVLLGEGDAFRSSLARRAIAERACAPNRAQRFASVRELRDAWG